MQQYSGMQIQRLSLPHSLKYSGSRPDATALKTPGQEANQLACKSPSERRNMPDAETRVLLDGVSTSEALQDCESADRLSSWPRLVPAKILS